MTILQEKKNVLDQLKIVSYINWIHTRYKIFVMRPLDSQYYVGNILYNIIVGCSRW